MGRRLVISNGTLAKEIQDGKYKVAVGGVVKQITKACVAQGGVVRQFWPPVATVLPPQEILWTTTAITVTSQETAPLEAVASIVFNRETGIYTYKDDPNATVSAYYLNPALDGTPGDDTKYLIRVDQVSGTALTGTLATWIDINSLAEHTWSLNKMGDGAVSAVATITIAEDDGGGSPAGGTSVAKTVNFSATVISSGSEGTITWSDTQEDLVEVKESIDADCELIFNPDGTAIGSADTSGSFTENWHSDTPAVSAPGNFTVNASLVSGTAPSGSALGSDLTLDVVRQWKLLATSGENLSCALDVTVSDGVVSITKRVTMNSERTAESATPVWTTDEWELTDSAFRQAIGLTSQSVITFLAAGGNATGQQTNQEGSSVQESDPWLPGGESSSDYEAKLSVVSGGDGLISHNEGQWYNLGTNQTFRIEYITVTVAVAREWTISIRKIGDIAVDKPLTITIAAASGETPP